MATVTCKGKRRDKSKSRIKGKDIKTPSKVVSFKKPAAKAATDKGSGDGWGKAVLFKKPAAKVTDKEEKAIVLMENGFRNFKHVLIEKEKT